MEALGACYYCEEDVVEDDDLIYDSGFGIYMHRECRDKEGRG